MSGERLTPSKAWDEGFETGIEVLAKALIHAYDVDGISLDSITVRDIKDQIFEEKFKDFGALDTMYSEDELRSIR